MGIPKGKQSKTIDQVHAGVTTPTFLHDSGNRPKDSLFHALLLHHVLLGQVLGKVVQQEFRVGIRIDVTTNRVSQAFRQFFRIGQIAIVRDANAVGIIGVEGLRFGTRGRTGRGVAAMTNAHVAAKLRHMMGLEDILHESVVLAQVQTTAFCRHHAGRVLTAVLQDGQAVKEELIDLCCRGRREDAERDRSVSLNVIGFLDTTRRVVVS